MMINNDVDTKSRIFLTASKLFALHGYENVSIRDLAVAVGVKSSSIYYHYDSKDAILADCYDYYTAHQYETRLTKNQYDPILRSGTKQDILGILNYSFKEVMKMFFLSIIVFSRLYIDHKAKTIYQDGINNSITYLNDFFRYGIEVGRFQDFNVPAYSVICLNARLFTATSVTLDPNQKKWRVTEVEVFNELAKVMPFNY